MSPSYLNGMMIGAGLIVAIGAQNAFVLAQSVRREHQWSVAATCALCDLVLICAGVFGLATLLVSSPILLGITRWAGAIFLFIYGLSALKRAIRPSALSPHFQPKRSFGAVMASTLAVTLLNPHVYLDTVVLVGSLGAQQPSPIAYAAGAASASILWFGLLAAAGSFMSKWLSRPSTWRAVDLLVAVMMWSLAARLVLET
ncbi:LysE/ArgO family amino acid transporter [Pseudomonas sp. Marseille-QA0892]